MKALSVIGIISSIFFISWSIFAFLTNGRISMGEALPVSIIFGLFTLVFSIVVLVTKKKKETNNEG